MLPGEKYLEKLEESGKSRRTAVKIRNHLSNILTNVYVSTLDWLKALLAVKHVYIVKKKYFMKSSNLLIKSTYVFVYFTKIFMKCKKLLIVYFVIKYVYSQLSIVIILVNEFSFYFIDTKSF